jgi:hypothetical protein
MNSAATAAVGKFVDLTTGRLGHSGLTLVTGGLTRTDTQPFGEAGPRARTDSARPLLWCVQRLNQRPPPYGGPLARRWRNRTRNFRRILHIRKLCSRRNSIMGPLAGVADVDNGRYGQSKQPLHFAPTALVFDNGGKRLHRGLLVTTIQTLVFYEIYEALAITPYQQFVLSAI